MDCVQEEQELSVTLNFKKKKGRKKKRQNEIQNLTVKGDHDS